MSNGLDQVYDHVLQHQVDRNDYEGDRGAKHFRSGRIAEVRGAESLLDFFTIDGDLVLLVLILLILPAEALHRVLVVGGVSTLKKLLIDEKLLKGVFHVAFFMAIVQLVAHNAIGQRVAEFQAIGGVGADIDDASRYREHYCNGDPHAHSALLSKPVGDFPVLPNDIGWFTRFL